MQFNRPLALATGALLAVSVASPLQAQQPQADEVYLSELYSTLEAIDPNFLALGERIGDDTNIQAAREFCQQLDNGQDVPEIFNAIQQDPDVAQMPPEGQAILGAYMGVIMAVGTPVYCDRHADAVNTFFSEQAGSTAP